MILFGELRSYDNRGTFLDRSVNKALQCRNVLRERLGLYYSPVNLSLASALSILLITMSVSRPARAEDEPFDSPIPASDPSSQAEKKSNDDVDIFLKGLNEATDADAQLAEARSETVHAKGSKKKANIKAKKSKRSKGGVQ